MRDITWTARVDYDYYTAIPEPGFMLSVSKIRTYKGIRYKANIVYGECTTRFKKTNKIFKDIGKAIVWCEKKYNKIANIGE